MSDERDAPSPAPAPTASSPAGTYVAPTPVPPGRSVVWPLLVGALVPAAVYLICRRPPEADSSDKLGSAPPPAPVVKAPATERERLESLLRKDPVAFLDHCLARYDAGIRNYTATLERRERVGRELKDGAWTSGELKEIELVECRFLEKPFSVYMHWTKNPQGADKALYVEGKFNNTMQVRSTTPGLNLLPIRLDPKSPLAMKTTRNPITEFGLRYGLVRAREALGAAAAKGELWWEYRGIQRVPECDDRECFVLVRTRYAAPEIDGITWLKLHIDCEKLVPIRAEMRGDRNGRTGADGELIGLYIFRDMRFNLDELVPEHFTAGRLGL